VSDQPKPGTSHAKSLPTDERKTSLDRQARLKDVFDRATAGLEAEKTQAQGGQEGRGEPKSHAPAPELHLRPEGEIRRAVDRQIDKEKLSKETARAEALAEEIRLKHNKRIELENEKNKADRER